MLDYMKGTITPKDWALNGGIFAVAVVLAVAFYFLVFTKQKEAVAVVEQDIEAVTAELNQAYYHRDNIETLREESRKMNKLVQLFEQRLPSEREITLLIQRFEDLADKVSVQVQLDALPTIPGTRMETIPYQIKAWGDFHKIVSFVNLLERENRYFKISNLDIGPEVEGTAEAKFMLNTFRFEQKKAMGE
jgi:Tfp pilus assembly protein PilO